MSGFAGAPTARREDVSRAATERTTAAAVTERERITGRTYSTEHHGRGWMVRLLLLLCLVDSHLSDVIEAELYVSPGDTVTLHCDGGTDKDSNQVEVSWEFGGMTVCLFQNGTLCEHRDFVNRTQFGSIQQNNFSLVINPVRLQDQGEYTCLINHTSMQINHLFVRGGRKQRAAEKLPEDSLVCKLYEDKDKEVPDENPPGTPSSGHLIYWSAVIAVILVIAVIAVIAKRLPIKWDQLRTRLML